MKILLLAILCASASPAGSAPRSDEALRWESRARNVEIVRDNRGIAHVYGKSDEDTG
jgi:acyl-homoserine lactone acylase PvdQ